MASCAGCCGSCTTLAVTSADVLAHLSARLRTVESQRTCPKCHMHRVVPEPSLYTVGGVPPLELTPTAADFLARHTEKPGTCGVEVMRSLVDMVSCLGSMNLPRTLGHPSVLEFVARHTAAFVCPGCDPRGFGLSRVCAAVVMSRGSLAFTDAQTLLQSALDHLQDGSDGEHDDVVDELDMMLRSANLGLSTVWFSKWAS